MTQNHYVVMHPSMMYKITKSLPSPNSVPRQEHYPIYAYDNGILIVGSPFPGFPSITTQRLKL